MSEIKKCLIIANGKPPSKRVISFLKSKGFNKIICADGGANTARKLNIIPDYIIGDLDSITPENKYHFAKLTNIIQIKRQNDTDVEKCIKYIIKKGYKECVLLGVIGNRLDHSFCNLGIVLKYSDEIRVRIISEQSVLSVAEKELKIRTIPGELFSLYAFDESTRITSRGLKYKLSETALPFGKRESTSNVALKEEVYLKITGGRIFIIRDFDIVKKYDLF